MEGPQLRVNASWLQVIPLMIIKKIPLLIGYEFVGRLCALSDVTFYHLNCTAYCSADCDIASISRRDKDTFPVTSALSH